MELKLEQMVTERRNENTMNLDMMSPLEIVTVMNQEDLLIPRLPLQRSHHRAR